jgi:hypothetical protein
MRERDGERKRGYIHGKSPDGLHSAGIKVESRTCMYLNSLIKFYKGSF